MQLLTRDGQRGIETALKPDGAQQALQSGSWQQSLQQGHLLRGDHAGILITEHGQLADQTIPTQGIWLDNGNPTTCKQALVR